MTGSVKEGDGRGLLVAVLGGQGSGKSTVTQALTSQLSERHPVCRVYLGSGNGDRSSARKLLSLMRKTRAAPERRAGSARGREPSWRFGERAYRIMWGISLAVERRAKLRRAVAARSNGALVITDRYPQTQIAGYGDGPLLQWAGGPLARWERRQYDPAVIPVPDLVIKLIAPRDVLQERRPHIHAVDLVRKQDGVVALRFPRSSLIILDASAPLDQVVAQARSAIERMLEGKRPAVDPSDLRPAPGLARGPTPGE